MNPQNAKSFSSLTPSYLLKVTKFVVKIFQFEFLVMTGKNIFAYKLFLSLNDCNPPGKSHPLFPSNLPLKVEALRDNFPFSIYY